MLDFHIYHCVKNLMFFIDFQDTAQQCKSRVVNKHLSCSLQMHGVSRIFQHMFHLLPIQLRFLPISLLFLHYVHKCNIPKITINLNFSKTTHFFHKVFTKPIFQKYYSKSEYPKIQCYKNRKMCTITPSPSYDPLKYLKQ